MSQWIWKVSGLQHRTIVLVLVGYCSAFVATSGFAPNIADLAPLVVSWITILARHTAGVVASGDKLAKLEKEELDFAKSSLLRELRHAMQQAPPEEGFAGSAGGFSANFEENAIRRAHRKIALRYRQNLFGDTAKFEFQMRVLNLARDALVRGDGGSGFPSDGGVNDQSGDGEGQAAQGGHELPSGSRMSEDILKNIYSWQEYALEEGLRFDSPNEPFFEGHTVHAFLRAFESNWTRFVHDEIMEMWPASAQLRLHVELQGGEAISDDGGDGRERARRLGDASRSLSRNAIAAIAGTLHACGARSPSLEGALPENDDDTGWVNLHMRASRALNVLLARGSSDWVRSSQSVAEQPDRHSTTSSEDRRREKEPLPCVAISDRDTRIALLELNIQALEKVSAETLGSPQRQALLDEIREAHQAISAARVEGVPLHCREIASQKRALLDNLWENYHFGPFVSEAYPLDACSLEGLASFLEFHGGPSGELLARKGEPDRSVLRAARGLLWLQRALVRPASLDSGQWREAVVDLESAVWQGVAFPELHDAAGRMLAEIAGAGLMPQVLEAALEHPAVRSSYSGETSRHGREPGDAQPAKSRRFAGLDVPGYSLRPIERYEEATLRMWGDEEKEENWDPVRVGLAMLDLVPSCEMPIQIAVCFLNAALWFWKALQLLGDKCGGDGWLDTYIFEDLWSLSMESKRLAMTFALKKAIFELIDYASLFAEHRLQPGARLAVHRTAYLTLSRVTSAFGATEDAPRVLAQLRRTLASARLNPFWAPPVLTVSDAIFADIVGGRLHASFLESLREQALVGTIGDRRQSLASVVPAAALEYCTFEGALLGLGDLVAEPASARYEAMGAILRDAGRHSWGGVEDVLGTPPFRADLAGFAVGGRPTVSHNNREFSSVRGLRINLRTGQASVLLSRPSSMETPLLSLDDVLGVLSLQEHGSMSLSLEPPTDGGGVKLYPLHPFQRVSIGISGLSREVEVTLLHSALALQQLAAGTEVAMRAPFPLRPCKLGLCQLLRGDARAMLSPVYGIPGEAWDPAPRLFLECSAIPYSQRMDGDFLEIRLGTPKFDIHPGNPLGNLDEETFRTWTVAKLKMALQMIEEADVRQAQFPTLEKQELVERLLNALRSGKLLESDEERGNPLASFSRRFQHHFTEIAEQWNHIGRLLPLCALRTVGLVLYSQLQQMREHAEAERTAVRASADAHVQAIRSQQVAHWQDVLGNSHQRLLQQLGVKDVDPSGCFSDPDNGLSFAKCCSLGDYASDCWVSLRGTQEGAVARIDSIRCCGASVRGEGVSREMLAALAGQLGSASPRRPSPHVLLPAVAAWLKDPIGTDKAGKAHSATVVNLLIDELSQEEFVQGTEEQLQQPVNSLAAELHSLKPLVAGHLLAEARGPNEAWVPSVPVAATGNRRFLYATVALAPRLESVEYSELDRHAESIQEVTLAQLVLRSGEAAPHASGTAFPHEPLASEHDLLQEITFLLSRLDSRVEEDTDGVGTTDPPKATYSHDEARDDDCSLDGWRELPANASQRLKSIVVGSRMRARRRLSEDVIGDVGSVRAVLTLTGQPGELLTVWEVLLDDGGQTQYLDPADLDLVVYAPCRHPLALLTAGGDASNENDSAGQSVATRPWPGCVEANLAFPSADGSGLFVNLGIFNVTRGCFLNDCSHSDHFASSSTSQCARICARVMACGWWTFQELAPPTCWLRGKHAIPQVGVQGYSSGPQACVPPPEESDPSREPTLFELVDGPAGVPPASLWQERDLVRILDDFGDLTFNELRRLRPSERYRDALHLASLVASKCAETWRGCG